MARKTYTADPQSRLIVQHTGNPRNPRRVQTACEGESLTRQSDAHETDVNVIIGRYLKTGDERLLLARAGQALYADVSEAPQSYDEMLQFLNTAQEAFGDLPAQVRDEYGNDPRNLVMALNDPNQWDRLRELGILASEEPQKDATPTTAGKEVDPTK